jgi:hypothetical protein
LFFEKLAIDESSPLRSRVPTGAGSLVLDLLCLNAGPELAGPFHSNPGELAEYHELVSQCPLPQCIPTDDCHQFEAVVWRIHRRLGLVFAGISKEVHI